MVDVDDMSKRSLIQHMKRKYGMEIDKKLDPELFHTQLGETSYDDDVLLGLFGIENIKSDLRGRDDVELCYLHDSCLPEGYEFKIKEGSVGLCLAMVKEVE